MAYFDTKSGSLEEAIRQAVSGQINEKKNVKETNKNDKSDDGEGLDAVQPKAVKKKFKDRKDKDIDNDGDTDSSDEFLHKKRKAISKAMAKETKKENFEVGTKERRDHTIEETPGQSVEDFEKQVDAMQSKNNYMREQLAKMWGMDEGKNPFVKDPKKEEKKPKTEKTMTGKKATEVKVDPDLDENKETGKKGVEQLKKETKLKGKNLQAACGDAAPAPSAGLTGS